MNTRHGILPDEMLLAYVNGMISKSFKMIPMKQDGVESLSLYIESTLREFIGQKELIFELKENEDFQSILGIMQSLLRQEDFAKFRSDVFKIINLIQRLKSSLGGDIQ